MGFSTRRGRQDQDLEEKEETKNVFFYFPCRMVKGETDDERQKNPFIIFLVQYGKIRKKERKMAGPRKFEVILRDLFNSVQKM